MAQLPKLQAAPNQSSNLTSKLLAILQGLLEEEDAESLQDNRMLEEQTETQNSGFYLTNCPYDISEDSFRTSGLRELNKLFGSEFEIEI